MGGHINRPLPNPRSRRRKRVRDGDPRRPAGHLRVLHYPRPQPGRVRVYVGERPLLVGSLPHFLFTPPRFRVPSLLSPHHLFSFVPFPFVSLPRFRATEESPLLPESRHYTVVNGLGEGGGRGSFQRWYRDQVLRCSIHSAPVSVTQTTHP